MNIYDFDDTIYDGDSCRDIIKYGIKHYPLKTIKSLFKFLIIYIKYKFKKVPFEQVKQEMLSFIFSIDNYEEFIDSFVDSHFKNIKKWYLDNKKENDIIATASYELWISKFAFKLGIKNVIATKTNNQGIIIGKNCKRKEKVVRIKKEFKNATFENSYSDSMSDLPILELSKKAFVVEGNKLIPYEKGYNFINRR